MVAELRRLLGLVLAGVMVWVIISAQRIDAPLVSPPVAIETRMQQDGGGIDRAASGAASAQLAALVVKGRAPKTGYDRSLFGQRWSDDVNVKLGHNGCDTRNDILRRDLFDRDMKNECKVLAGTLAPDPYTGMTIRFEYAGASEVDIDHVVALSDSWQKGATAWPAGKRLTFANDPLNLLAVDAGANRSKGAGDAATWLPPNRGFRCTYAARQIAVKAKYDLWVTPAEKTALARILNRCNRSQPVQGESE